MTSISTEVVVHPLVLLSVTDHYNRVAKDTRKRVEDLSNPKVWFLDHNFLETMYWMFKKVNTNENIMGFYSSGPKIKENDLKISALFERFCANDPVFVIIDVRPGVTGIPTTAYQAVEEVEGEGKEIQRVFKHISCVVEADEVEEVGVEHLLRDINDPSTSTLALQIQQKTTGLKGLLARLQEIRAYLENVANNRLPVNNQISYNLQNMLNLVPNLNVEELVRSMLVKTNDMHLVMYVSALIRSILALHGLLANKIKYRDIDDILVATPGPDKATAITAESGAEKKDNSSKDSSTVDGEGSKNGKSAQ